MPRKFIRTGFGTVEAARVHSDSRALQIGRRGNTHYTGTRNVDIDIANDPIKLLVLIGDQVCEFVRKGDIATLKTITTGVDHTLTFDAKPIEIKPNKFVGFDSSWTNYKDLACSANYFIDGSSRIELYILGKAHDISSIRVNANYSPPIFGLVSRTSGILVTKSYEGDSLYPDSTTIHIHRFIISDGVINIAEIATFVMNGQNLPSEYIPGWGQAYYYDSYDNPVISSNARYLFISFKRIATLHMMFSSDRTIIENQVFGILVNEDLSDAQIIKDYGEIDKNTLPMTQTDFIATKIAEDNTVIHDTLWYWGFNRLATSKLFQQSGLVTAIKNGINSGQVLWTDPGDPIVWDYTMHMV